MSKGALLVGGIATAAIVGMVVVLVLSFGKDPHEVPFALRDKPAPAFKLKRLDGAGEVSSSDFQGKPIMLNYWASWCIPCAQEHSSLVRASREWGSRVQFVGIVYQDTDPAARAYLAEHGAPYPQLVDPGSEVALDYGVAGVPETYFIDAHGIVRDKFAGPLDARRISERLRWLTSETKEASR
jgi:cytochrome c biogenesis protein CcmG, thiol:disulfide interchange protein DsbE